ncbi:hypothetical protein [Novosphingobium colocasiae]|uniref:hypothetical protein n=1 Tax=Novosphingobium colocasiae TaxID=1256513 RepID=UPI0035B0063C
MRAGGTAGVAGNARTGSILGQAWRSGASVQKLLLAGFIALCLFNLALPKGGFRLLEYPVTWGYIILAMLAVPAAVNLLVRGNLAVQPIIHFGLFCLPVSLLIVVKAVVYSSPPSETVVYLTVFMAMPLIMLVLMAPFLEDLPAQVIGTIFVWCIRFTVAWGLMNFILYPFIKNIVQIPYITVNVADYGTIFLRNNTRGPFLKLLSTYNNGNLYGDCMLMLAPIYFLYERSRVWMLLLIAALVCTLSRTVWIGMLAVAGLMMLTGQVNLRRASLWGGIVAGLGLILVLIPAMGWTAENVVNAQLGGRIRSFTTFELTLFGRSKLAIPEMVYFGMLNSFGVLGFPFALGTLFAGPIFAITHFNQLSPLRKAAFCGLGGYLVAAMSDGAFVFPPTMVLFYLVTGLLYRRGLRPTGTNWNRIAS